jgi:predicted RNA methylase
VTRDARARLRHAADTLLDEDGPLFRWAEAARDLDVLLGEVGGAVAPVGPDVPTQLAAGLALSPTAAARCLQDVARTARFAQGLATAVRDAAARRAPAEVVYAGCGPFALLCLPLLAREAPARVTLVDVHAASLHRARKVLEGCGLADRVDGYVCGDATTYRHPRPIDVAVTETMGQALEKEPQVAVMAALAPQLAPGGVLVPERLRVEACLADAAREFAIGDAPLQRPRIVLGDVLDVSAASAGRVLSAGATVRLTVPGLAPGDPAELMLRTTVVVHGPIVLREYDSGLTYPKFLHALGRLAPRQVVEIAYRTGESPGFECRLVRPGMV